MGASVRVPEFPAWGSWIAEMLKPCESHQINLA